MPRDWGGVCLFWRRMDRLNPALSPLVLLASLARMCPPVPGRSLQVRRLVRSQAAGGQAAEVRGRLRQPVHTLPAAAGLRQQPKQEIPPVSVARRRPPVTHRQLELGPPALQRHPVLCRLICKAPGGGREGRRVAADCLMACSHFKCLIRLLRVGHVRPVPAWAWWLHAGRENFFCVHLRAATSRAPGLAGSIQHAAGPEALPFHKPPNGINRHLLGLDSMPASPPVSLGQQPLGTEEGNRSSQK